MGNIFAQLSPKAMENFNKMCADSFVDGKLTVKEKELITLAIAISVRCQACIEAHAAGCINAGCTLEEISEMVEICVIMQGGPGFAFGNIALEAAEKALASKQQ